MEETSLDRNELDQQNAEVRTLTRNTNVETNMKEAETAEVPVIRDDKDDEMNLKVEEYLLQLDNDDDYSDVLWEVRSAESFSVDENSDEDSFPITTRSCRLLTKDDALSYSRKSLVDSTLQSIPETTVCPEAPGNAGNTDREEKGIGPNTVEDSGTESSKRPSGSVKSDNDIKQNKLSAEVEVEKEFTAEKVPDENPSIARGNETQPTASKYNGQDKCTRTCSNDTSQSVSSRSAISVSDIPNKKNRRKHVSAVASTDTDSTSVSGKASKRKVLRNFSERSVSSLVRFFDKRKRGIKKRFSIRKVVDLGRLKTSETQTQMDATNVSEDQSPNKDTATTNLPQTNAIDLGAVQNDAINTTNDESLTNSNKFSFSCQNSDTSLSPLSSPSSSRSDVVCYEPIYPQLNLQEVTQTFNTLSTTDTPVVAVAEGTALQNGDCACACNEKDSNIKPPAPKVELEPPAPKFETETDTNIKVQPSDASDSSVPIQQEPVAMEIPPPPLTPPFKTMAPDATPDYITPQIDTKPISTTPHDESARLSPEVQDYSVDTGFESEESIDSGCPIVTPKLEKTKTEIIVDVHRPSPAIEAPKKKSVKVAPAEPPKPTPAVNTEVPKKCNKKLHRPRHIETQTHTEDVKHNSRNLRQQQERRKTPNSLASSTRNSVEYDDETLQQLFTKEKALTVQTMPDEIFGPQDYAMTVYQPHLAVGNPQFMHPGMLMPNGQQHFDPGIYHRQQFQSPYDIPQRPSFIEPRPQEPMRMQDPYAFHAPPPNGYMPPPPQFHPAFPPRMQPMFVRNPPPFNPRFEQYQHRRHGPREPPHRPPFMEHIEMPQPRPQRMRMPPEDANPETYMRTWMNEIENNCDRLVMDVSPGFKQNFIPERFPPPRRVSFGEDLVHEDYNGEEAHEPDVYDLYHNQYLPQTDRSNLAFGPVIERRGRPGLNRRASTKRNRPSFEQQKFDEHTMNAPETYDDFVQRLSRELRNPELGLHEYNFRCDIMTCINRLQPVVRWNVLFQFYEEAMSRFERILMSNLSPVNKEKEWKMMLDRMVDDIHYFNVELSPRDTRRPSMTSGIEPRYPSR